MLFGSSAFEYATEYATSKERPTESSANPFLSTLSPGIQRSAMLSEIVDEPQNPRSEHLYNSLPGMASRWRMRQVIAILLPI